MWSTLVGMESSFCGFSPESSCTDGSPRLSGVSLTKRSITTEPMKPASAAAMKPHCQPASITTCPSSTIDTDFPRYGVAQNML